MRFGKFPKVRNCPRNLGSSNQLLAQIAPKRHGTDLPAKEVYSHRPYICSMEMQS